MGEGRGEGCRGREGAPAAGCEEGTQQLAFDYPVYLNLADKSCVVVGGGDVAARKAAALVEAGARVVVVSPNLVPGLELQRDRGDLKQVARGYREGDLARAWLAIAATDDTATNTAVADEGRRLGILVNVVDDAELCNFALPAVLSRGDLRVAVGTGGQSPTIARYVRDRLDDFLAPEYLELLDVAAEVRATLKRLGRRVDGEA